MQQKWLSRTCKATAQENIVRAIAVVFEDGGASTCALEDEVLLVFATEGVGNRQARLSRDIDESEDCSSAEGGAIKPCGQAKCQVSPQCKPAGRSDRTTSYAEIASTDFASEAAPAVSRNNVDLGRADFTM
jgi:hypothetical protein